MVVNLALGLHCKILLATALQLNVLNDLLIVPYVEAIITDTIEFLFLEKLT